jgi:small subunit ribosomal protein S13
MARLLGLVLPDSARIEYALTLIYGVGWHKSRLILSSVKVDGSTRVRDLTEDDVKKIASEIEKTMTVEGDLREDIAENIKRAKEVTSYRGIRHMRGLPVRGQRTRSNARTRRGKRQTVGALTKEAWAKLEQNKSGKK